MAAADAAARGVARRISVRAGRADPAKRSLCSSAAIAGGNSAGRGRRRPRPASPSQSPLWPSRSSGATRAGTRVQPDRTRLRAPPARGIATEGPRRLCPARGAAAGPARVDQPQRGRAPDLLSICNPWRCREPLSTAHAPTSSPSFREVRVDPRQLFHLSLTALAIFAPSCYIPCDELCTLTRAAARSRRRE